MYILVTIFLAFFLSSSMAALVWYDFFAQRMLRVALVSQEYESIWSSCSEFVQNLYKTVPAMRHALISQGYYRCIYKEHPRYTCRCLCSWHDEAKKIVRVTCTLSNQFTKVLYVRLSVV